MKTTIQWDICDTSVESGQEAIAFIDGQGEKVNNWGTRGFALLLGPDGIPWSELPLRIDFAPDAGAAAIRWLPENLVAVTDFHHGQPLHVLEDSGDPLVEIPAELVRSTIDSATAAAAEYVDTGQRPTSFTWQPVA